MVSVRWRCRSRESRWTQDSSGAAHRSRVEQIADVLVPQIMKQRFNEVVKMIFPERVSERTVGLSDVVPVYQIMEELMNVIQKGACGTNPGAMEAHC